MASQELVTEWTTLQAQSDRFEQQSLLIKLVATTLTSALLALQVDNPSLAALPLIFWLQEAIWKTYQKRTDSRLILIEQAIATDDTENNFAAIQFNRDFAANRPSTAGLLREYFSQACRPTVAFPHALLSILTIVEILR